MTNKEAAKKLGCVHNSVSVLVSRGKLERGATCHEVSDVSVARYAATRRDKRKAPGGTALHVRHVPRALLRRFRAAVPGRSSLVQCLIEAIEMWLKEKGK